LQPHSARATAWFAILALAVLASTAVLAWRSRRVAPEYAFSLILTAGLLLYPSTLAHYGMLLIVPLLLFWEAQQRRLSDVAAAAFVTLAALVTGFAHGSYAFWAMAGVWFAFAVLVTLRPVARDVAFARAMAHSAAPPLRASGFE